MGSISSLLSSISSQKSPFTRMDSDGSGTISKDEFVAARPKEVSADQASTLYDKIDSSGTNALTEDQLNKGLAANRPDKTAGVSNTDLNGNLSADVISSLMQILQQLTASSNTTSPANAENLSIDGSSPPSTSDMFSKMDSNSDGKVTKDEFVAARPDDISEEQASSLFDSIDSEGTGSITEEQFANSMQKHGAPPAPPPSDTASGSDNNANSNNGNNMNELLMKLVQSIEAYMRTNSSDTSTVATGTTTSTTV